MGEIHLRRAIQILIYFEEEANSKLWLLLGEGQGKGYKQGEEDNC